MLNLVADYIAARVSAVLTPVLTQILTLQRSIMAKIEDVTSLVSAINDETNAVAAKVDAQATQIKQLQDQIAAGSPVTQEQLDAVASGLTDISTRLQAVAADPDNPIPAQ